MSRSSRVAIWLSVTVALLGVFSVAAILAWVFRDALIPTDDFSQTVAEAKALGLPLHLADLRPRPPVLVNENAAPLIWQACNAPVATPAARRAREALGVSLRRRLGAPTQVDLQRATQLRSLCELALRAAAKPRCDFGYDYDLGPDVLVPELNALRAMTEALSFRSIVEARMGRKADALRDLGAALVLSRHCVACKSVVGALAAVACEAIAVDAGERVATACADDPAALAEVGRAIDASSATPDLASALKGQFYMSLAYCRNYGVRDRLEPLSEADEKARRGIGPPPDKSVLVREGLPHDPVVRSVAEYVVSCWVELFQAIVGETDALKIRTAILKVSRGKSTKLGLASEFTADVWNDTVPACVAIARREAGRRCSSALVRVLEYRALHKAFPKTLADAGADGIDPFDGEPLRYKVARGVCKVYSVGPDLKDDGGLDRRDVAGGAKGDSGWDVVARYPAHVSKKKQ